MNAFLFFCRRVVDRVCVVVVSSLTEVVDFLAPIAVAVEVVVNVGDDAPRHAPRHSSSGDVVNGI